MIGLWQDVQNNAHSYTKNLVLVVAAVWLLLSRYGRNRAAVLAAVALLLRGLVLPLLYLPDKFGFRLPPGYYQAVQWGWLLPPGLLFSAVLIDRRRGTTDA